MSPDKQSLDGLKIDRSKAPKGRSPVPIILGIILALLIVGVVAWWVNRAKPITVRTVVVQQTSSGGASGTTLLNASGYVTARREATVSSKVTGKVIEVMVEEGMKVDAGQVLAKIDASNVERSLHLAEAQAESARKGLDETKANLELAEREQQRAAQLAAARVASASEAEKAEAEAKSLRARLQKQTADIAVAEREVALWKQQMDDTIIRAPFGGIVTSKNAQPGEMISPMSSGGFTRTGICTIVDMSSLEIEVDVNENYINRVEAGQPVEAVLDAYPEWRIAAKVIAIIPTADRQKATVKVRVGFEKLDPRILPDMGVKVAFQKAGREAVSSPEIVVPKAAVLQQDGRDIVWVFKEGRVERRAVGISVTRADDVSVSAGLQAGERVVIDGAKNLTDGAPVTESKQ
jgi:RND family efflux transporter MFP subunit